MISSKRKRKLIFQEENYYWYIRKNEEDVPVIHIVSEDKTLHLEYGFDRERGIGGHYIEELLSNYFEKYSKT